MLGICWCGATAWPPCHCVVRKSIFCHFDLGTDWPVRPLMQVDKAVIHQFFIVPAMQFAWTTVYLWHAISTSGWGLVGLQVLLHTVHATRMTQNPEFLNSFCFSCWKHSRSRSMIFALSSWIMWGTHHQSTLAIAMNFAKHGAFLIVLALGLAHTMANTTS